MKAPFQLLHGCQPGLPSHMYSLIKPILAITPDVYLQKLAQTLIRIQAEAYTVNLNGKLKDVEHATTRRPAHLPDW